MMKTGSWAMRFRRTVTAIAATTMAVLGTANAAAQERLSPNEIERVAQAVVRIESMRNGRVISRASGTIITTDGMILTNRHVVEDADDWQISTLREIDEPPVRRYRATLSRYSDEVDMAVLYIDRTADGRQIDPDNLHLPTAIEAEEPLRRGEYIGLFGYPGIGGGVLTFSDGSITAVQNGHVAGRATPVVYRTDAEIGHGNSGGLAVNSDGEMVGIPWARDVDGSAQMGLVLPLNAILEAASAGLTEVDKPLTANFLETNAEATYERIIMSVGESRDGYTAPGTSGGPIDISQLIDGCNGYVSAAPDYRVRWIGVSRSDTLAFMFAHTEDEDGIHDTTLTVLSPDGRWFCDDDGAGELDPMVLIDDPTPGSGEYLVWAGSYAEDEYIAGELFVVDSASIATTESLTAERPEADHRPPSTRETERASIAEPNYGPWLESLNQAARVCVLGIGRQAVEASPHVVEALHEAERYIVQESCTEYTDIVFILSDDTRGTLTFTLTAQSVGADEPFWVETMPVRWMKRGAALDLGKAFNAWAEQWVPTR